ncbi:hypothetical protein MRX96_015674 [Rhipicephalus microplus]
MTYRPALGGRVPPTAPQCPPPGDVVFRCSSSVVLRCSSALLSSLSARRDGVRACLARRTSYGKPVVRTPGGTSKRATGGWQLSRSSS